VWIVPKTLSAFVPDTEGLNLDLEERAWMLESSAMWRSKPSSKQTWLRRLKKDEWMTRLSTRILKPSQQKYFEEKYTDSLEDIPVSPSVARGSEKEKKTQGTYGHTSENMSGQLDLFGAFSKMSEATPRWGYGESCPIWKKMVTERSGDCSARRKQARLTNASECSSWPTPQASEGKANRHRNNPNAKGSQKWLTTIVMDNWSTPQARDWKDSVTKLAKDRKDGKKRNDQLPRQIAELNWPTPRAGNPGSRKPGTGGKILAEEAKKNWATPNTMDYLPPKTGEALARNKKKGGCKNLREDVNNPKLNGPPAQEKSSTSGKNQESWLTPKSRDYRDVENHILKTGENVRKTGQKFSVGLPTQAHMKEFPEAKKAQAKLNPNWVEQLMGLPIGWTDLGSWATESSHKPQN